jgi:hypothetical protein
MTETPATPTLHRARQILPILACVVLMTAGCSAFDTTNNSDTNTGSCNGAGGNNSVSCSSVPTAHASAVASASSASVASSASASPYTGKTWKETTFSNADTFADFVNAGDPQGASLKPQQAVYVSCRVKGFVVHDGDGWWYRLARSPWNNRYYASTDNFYNTPSPTPNPINGVVFDKRVPVC